ncbi:MAG: hypothetical protein ABIC36_02690 [bacterium]
MHSRREILFFIRFVGGFGNKFKLFLELIHLKNRRPSEKRIKELRLKLKKDVVELWKKRRKMLLAYHKS